MNYLDYLHTGVMIGDRQVDIRYGLVSGVWRCSRHFMCGLSLEHSHDRTSQVRIDPFVCNIALSVQRILGGKLLPKECEIPI